MLEQIEAVQRMQDYIAAHLYEELTLADLSKVSFYSPWYSYRLFKEWLHITPADYTRRLRLSASALRLRDEHVRITDVALESGFNSVDGYQRAFYRAFACNPHEFAKNPVPIPLFTPYGIRSAKLRKEVTMQNVKNIFIQIVEKPARKVLVKRGVNAEDYFSYCEEVGCDIWGLLVSMKSLCGEPVSLWLPEQYRKPGTSKYVQGVEAELSYDGVVPEGFDVIELPQATYMLFQGEPFAEADYEEAIAQVWEAIKRYDPTTVGYEWDETNPRIQLEPIGTRGYMELLPVRKRA